MGGEKSGRLAGGNDARAGGGTGDCAGALRVIAAVVPQLGPAADAALRVVPIYIAFAIVAPFLGWLVARRFRLQAAAGRSIAFSTGTRNSLVVLPLALAVPGAVPVLPAIIVTQTLVELLSELVYVRLIATLGRDHSGASQPR